MNLGTLNVGGLVKLSHESFVLYLWGLGSRWVGRNAWCNMESRSGKRQNGDVWDENLRVWGFAVHLWDVGSRWVGTKCVVWDGELLWQSSKQWYMRWKSASFPWSGSAFRFEQILHLITMWHGVQLQDLTDLPNSICYKWKCVAPRLTTNANAVVKQRFKSSRNF